MTAPVDTNGGQLVLFDPRTTVRRMVRHDGWQNIATGLGVEGKDPRLETQYARRKCELSQMSLEAMYEENWAFQRIVDAIPENAVRRWIKVQAQTEEAEKKLSAPKLGGKKKGTTEKKAPSAREGDSEDFGKEVIDWLDDELEARERFFEWHRLGRLYGGSILLYGVNDGLSIDKPLDIERVTEVTHLTPLSRFEVAGVEWDMKPSSPTYGKILQFILHGENIPVHASRCAIYSGIVSSRRRQLERGGWGVSVHEPLAEPLRRFGTIYDYVEALYKDVVQGIITIPGLDEMVSSDEGNQLAISRLRLMAYTASAFGAVLLNEGETYERRGATFSGISEPILRAMDELAGAARMPLSILFGQAPTGLSTDDKSGMRNFYDSIANEQRRLYRRPLETLIKMGQSAGVISKPNSWSLEFNPLEEPSDAEMAATDLVRAQTDGALIERNIIDENEARTRWKNDPKSPYTLEGDAPEPDPEPTAEDVAMLQEEAGAQRTDAGDFDESKHPRAPDGKFGEGGDQIDEVSFDDEPGESHDEAQARISREIDEYREKLKSGEEKWEVEPEEFEEQERTYGPSSKNVKVIAPGLVQIKTLNGKTTIVADELLDEYDDAETAATDIVAVEKFPAEWEKTKQSALLPGLSYDVDPDAPPDSVIAALKLTPVRDEWEAEAIRDHAEENESARELYEPDNEDGPFEPDPFPGFEEELWEEHAREYFGEKIAPALERAREKAQNKAQKIVGDAATFEDWVSETHGEESVRTIRFSGIPGFKDRESTANNG